MGLINGLKEEEIRECLLHVMGYCGFPAGLDAYVFKCQDKEIIADQTGSRPQMKLSGVQD
jgi:alkylhydroperoxidase/carboxymuconolactone decarboxylase family protein YurZ